MEGKKLSSIAVEKEDVFLGTDEKCPECKIDFKNIKSVTNSFYYYCSKCNYNKRVVEKHMVFDELLKSMQKYFTKTINNKIESLKIDLLKKDDNIGLKVNNIEIRNIKIYTNLSNKDIKSLIYTIEDLVEDCFGEGAFKSSISVAI